MKTSYRSFICVCQKLFFSKARLTEKDVSRILGCLIRCVDYMHQHGFVHRDLKPENILLKRPGVDSPLKVTYFYKVCFCTKYTFVEMHPYKKNRRRMKPSRVL